MINPMNVYINKLAETARDMCGINTESKDDYKLNLDYLKKAISYFNGELKHYNSNEEMSKECGFEMASNCFLKKREGKPFLIGYIEFIAIDILHELGHAALELQDMYDGEVRLLEDYNGGMNEINASKFARAFIMPSHIFQKVVIQNTKDGLCDIQLVANVFGVEYSQVVSRGRESNLWD